MISREILGFLTDRRAAHRSRNTIEFYERELDYLSRWLEPLRITLMSQITTELIRQYLIDLATHRNSGGVHAAYRAIKAWLMWYAAELDDPAWKNPIRKVTAPTPKKDPLPGVTVDEIHALLSACKRTKAGARDRAIITALFDTGLRAFEFVKLNYGDINLKTGAVMVRAGKGNKDRTVFMGARARREIVRWLRYRGDLLPSSPLWITLTGTRLTRSGLRQVLRRRSEQAGIPEPSAHDFRRAFAIESLRNGIDLITLMRLMGHTSTVVLQRYLKLIDDDLQAAVEKSSPADNL